MNAKIKQPLENQPLNWRHIVWFLVVWLFLIFIFRGLAPAPSSQEISYTDFKKKVGRGAVAQITIKGNQISGKFKPQISDKEPQQPQSSNSFFQFFQGNPSQPDYFQTTKPALQDPALLPLLEKNEVDVRAETQKRSWLATLIITLLPWLLIFGLFYDEEIQQIVGQMAQKAEETLADNRPKLEALAGELLKHESLTRDEVDQILAHAGETDN